ncbi:MAG: TlpA family protein disulfide reductase, partial [Rubrivivax sp.]
MSVTPHRRRQTLVLAGVAAAAAAAGVGWQRLRAPARPEGPPWDQRFPTPDGAELDMAAFHGRPLVLNFWATWCPPCIKELPELERFHRECTHKVSRLVGLAVDGVKTVRELLH